MKVAQDVNKKKKKKNACKVQPYNIYQIVLVKYFMLYSLIFKYFTFFYTSKVNKPLAVLLCYKM